MELCFIGSRFYLSFCLALQGDEARCGVSRRFCYAQRIVYRGDEMGCRLFFVDVNVRVASRDLRAIWCVPNLPLLHTFGSGVFCGVDRSLFVFDLVADANVRDGAAVDRVKGCEFAGGPRTV